MSEPILLLRLKTVQYHLAHQANTAAPPGGEEKKLREVAASKHRRGLATE